MAQIFTRDPQWPFLPSPGILQREDFGHLLNLRGLRGNAVEIGTHRGEFAEVILERWEGCRLYCVDPWQDNLEGYSDYSTRNRNADMEACKERLARFCDRAQYMRMLSEEAAKSFEARSLDFVYIDGNHQYAFVRADIELWWPRIRPRGILAGHDLNGDWGPGHVAKAVAEFGAEKGLPIYYMLGDAASWYCPKYDHEV